MVLMKEMSIVDRLKDLHKQATTERSHYYVAATCKLAIAEIERRNWRPIETAPKAGVFIVARPPRCDGVRPVALVYRNVSGGMNETEIGFLPVYDATHWMELPPPPADGGA